MRTPYPQHSLTASKIVPLRRVVSPSGISTLLLTIMLALLSYWLGYTNGSYRAPQVKVETPSPTPAPLAFKRTPGYPEGDPAIKFGVPVRIEP